MPKVVKPGANNQPEGTYIEVESNGGRVDGAVTIEIERGGDPSTDTEAGPGMDKKVIEMQT